jgi:ribosomal-protein-alanine N-acetyltransferase
MSAAALPQPVSIAPATWRDFREVMALERACFASDSWPWIDIMAALTFPDAVRLKAVASQPVAQGGEANGRRAIGFVFGDRNRSHGLGWIASIGVHPDYQRRGIGSRLLAACERALGTPQIRLTLRPTNLAARRVYDAAGYVEVGRLERYYRDGEDGIVMEKLIG